MVSSFGKFSRISTQAIPLFAVEDRRFISHFDEEHARPVVVLGAGLADSLFHNLDPLGKTVHINGYSYDVIGIFAYDSGLFGAPGVDQFAVVPFSDFHKKWPDVRELVLAVTINPGVDPGSALSRSLMRCDAFVAIRANAGNDFSFIRYIM